MSEENAEVFTTSEKYLEYDIFTIIEKNLISTFDIQNIQDWLMQHLRKLQFLNVDAINYYLLIIFMVFVISFIFYSIYRSFEFCDGIFGEFFVLNFKWHRNYEKFNVKYEGTYDLNKVNDESSDFEKYPWIVRIIGEKDGDVSFLGTGLFVSDRVILTAAHCIEIDEYKLKELQIGGTAENKFKDTLIIPINEGSKHIYPKYDTKSDLNDIGIIKLKNPIKLSKTVHPIRLPFDHAEVPQNLTFTGWVGDDPLNNPKVKEETLPVISENDGKKNRFRKLIYKTLLIGLKIKTFPHRISAGRITTIIKKGDSGSPLVLMNENGPIAFGIASLGRIDETTNPDLLIPGLFTNIYPYLHWILCNGGD